MYYANIFVGIKKYSKSRIMAASIFTNSSNINIQYKHKIMKKYAVLPH